MALSKRTSALAVLEETTEGTPVAPSAATDYVALQDDFTMEPSFDVLENAELKASLGSSKPILGAENPTASFSHYLRHSGVEGQAPNYSLLLKAMFGTETILGTETTTSGAQTVSSIGVADDASYALGTAVLVKDATLSGGYSIRAIDSAAANALVPGFDLPAAAATGAGCGKFVSYSPANSGHVTLSIWHYIANGGNLQMSSGVRPTSMAMSASAGELVNVSYDMGGIAYYWNPLTVDATNDNLDINYNAGGEENLTIASKTYKDPYELAAAVQVQLQTTDASLTCVFDDATGKFTIAGTATFDLLWSTGTNTATTIGGLLGFTVSADDTGASTYLADSAIAVEAPQTPTFDDSDPLAAKNHEVMFGDSTDYVCFQASTVDVAFGAEKKDLEDICAESGRSGSLYSSRAVTFTITHYLDQYQSEEFRKFRTGDNVKFQYSFGTKSGGNWVAGKCGCWYMPTGTITSYSIGDDEDVVTLNMEITTYVPADGSGEVFLNFV